MNLSDRGEFFFRNVFISLNCSISHRIGEKVNKTQTKHALRIAVGITILLLLAGNTTAQESLPDLIISDIKITPQDSISPQDLIYGDMLTIEATVKNIGTATVTTDFYVFFYHQDMGTCGAPYPNDEIVLVSQDLASGESTIISISEPAVGDCGISFRADEEQNVIESDESNNGMNKQMNTVAQPSITVNPSSFNMGTHDQILTITGSGFIRNSMVTINDFRNQMGCPVIGNFNPTVNNDGTFSTNVVLRGINTCGYIPGITTIEATNGVQEAKTTFEILGPNPNYEYSFNPSSGLPGTKIEINAVDFFLQDAEHNVGVYFDNIYIGDVWRTWVFLLPLDDLYIPLNAAKGWHTITLERLGKANFYVTSNDNTPPSTNIDISGISGNNGWYTSNVQVTLTATDNEGGSGVGMTEYSNDDGTTWSQYSIPFIISTEAATKISYKSTDIDGNVEPIKTYEINIDKTIPTITIISPESKNYFRTESLQLNFNALDSISGIDSITSSLDGTIVTNGQVIDLSTLIPGQHTLTVNSIDKAGNTATNSVIFNLIIPATVDVNPDTLNKDSKGGTVATYIEIPGYDINNIDITTVRLSTKNGMVSAQLTPISKGDYDSDGIPDRMVKFDRQAVIGIVDIGNVVITISGKISGEDFEGSDEVRIIGKAEQIPEFPTVALPIISVIGLMFLFQRRRGK